MAVPNYPVADRVSIDKTTYHECLSINVVALIASYVLYDHTQNYKKYVRIFQQPMFFGRFGCTDIWDRMLTDGARFVYHRYWSSNNYTSVLRLRHDGTINYDYCLAEAWRNIYKIRKFGDGSMFTTEKCWRHAHSERYDLFLIMLQGHIAAEIRFFRISTLGDVDCMISNRLERYLGLADLLTVAHLSLEEEILALCALVPDHVYFLLYQADLGVVNYSFWMTLYETYVQPNIDKPLCRDDIDIDSLDEVNYWRGLWFQAVIQKDDIPLFVRTCEELGFVRTKVIEIIHGQGGDVLGLNMDTFCRADAINLITELDIWSSITSYHVSKFIILTAPKIYEALVARSYVFSFDELINLKLHGTPANIALFLPVTITPAFITKTRAPSAMLFFAILICCQRELTWCELYQLFMSPAIKYANLINYVLPVEQFMEPSIQTRFNYLDQHWGFIPTIDDGQEPIDPVLLNRRHNYARLYRLLLLYVMERRAPLRTTFHRHSRRDFRTDHNVIKYGQFIGGDEDYEIYDDDESDVTFWPRSYSRMLTLRNSSASFLDGTRRYVSNGIIFVYLPPRTKIRIFHLSTNAEYALYDYGVEDFTWWCEAYKARYGREDDEEEDYGESDSGSDG